MDEERSYEVLREVSEFGRTRILVRCPFCRVEEWAYIWSMAGKGKKCPGCGAKHFYLPPVSKRKTDTCEALGETE